MTETTDEQAHDSGWVDGYSIDSDTTDGKWKIDLQSQPGEQQEVHLTPDVVDESESETGTGGRDCCGSLSFLFL